MKTTDIHEFFFSDTLQTSHDRTLAQHNSALHLGYVYKWMEICMHKGFTIKSQVRIRDIKPKLLRRKIYLSPVATFCVFKVKMATRQEFLI